MDVTGRRIALAMAGLTLFRPGDPRAETEEGMIIFSALRGVVLARGRPVPGARVVRSWHWGLTDERGGDAAVTDAEGRFGLPAVVRRGGLRRWLPHEPFVEQTIDVVHGSATQAVWMLDRRNYRPGGELGPERSASALAVTIELDAPLAHRGPVYGRATIAPLDPAVPPPA